MIALLLFLDVTAALRGGVYADDDRTQVYRSLASAQGTFGRYTVSAQEEVDVLTSASADVRASPFLDTLTGASPQRPRMSDVRFETAAGGSWDDGDGHVLGASVVYATERDYSSAGGGLRASWDFAKRNTTLFGGVNVTSNDVSSIADASFHASLAMAGYTVGVAQVLSPRDALRMRYDGAYLDGYQASPYRSVRFGNWRTALRPGGEGLLFLDTIGSPNGLPEQLPGTRMRHAVVVEWLRALANGVAVLPSYRFAADDWGVLAHTLAAEVRLLRGQSWQARAGYRFYLQSAADFWQTRYVRAPETYRYYSADKELGDERGHSAMIDLARTFRRGQLDVKIEYIYYSYPGFALLGQRSSVFGELGWRMQF